MTQSVVPRPRRRRSRLQTVASRVRAGAQNALEIARLGRLSPREWAPYDVVHTGKHYRLRRYDGAGREDGPALLLIPPLMLTAEIYDVAPDLSAAAALCREGVDTWVVDFGAPERIEGGMTRTLDDHVRSVDDAVDRVAEATGKDVHLAGYSQGGMFAYQVAAYRRSKSIASVITFGSPVDIHKNLPSVSTDVTARMIRAARPFIEPTLKRVEGLPGILTSTGFKLFSFRRELGQVAEFISKLHDRQALEKRENRRRFLGGEGFVAWPGPALLKFIEEFIVHNRMTSGGFVIDGRTVTLTDIRCPILYFVGGRDDIARPPSVRAIREAAPAAQQYEVTLPAGHFGLVVGSTAMRETWSTVIEWLTWREQEGALPKLLAPKKDDAVELREVEDLAFEEGLDFDLFYDVAVRTAESAWKWLGDSVEDVGDNFDQVRYQLPRLWRLRNLKDDERVSISRLLARQAKRIPEKTVFIYKGRAVTYAEVDRRVTNVAKGLVHCGVYPGDRVGVLMRTRPSYLSIVGGLNRLGAVPVLIPPGLDDVALGRAIGLGQLRFLVADPDHAEQARSAFSGDVLVLGGGGPNRPLCDGVTDMERIDPDAVELPSWYQPNPGRAADLGMVIVTIGLGRDRAARITNRRWAFSALGAAAACTLTPRDTVYCCLPLHHPAGHLVSVGSALAGGARLALATRFEPETFWSEVHRSGATVVFYAGEMLRELVDAPPNVAERNNPLRLFAGSGMRKDVWRSVGDRFDTGVLEFYASTEASLVLANASGSRMGAVGRPLPGSADAMVVAYDFDDDDFVRDGLGGVVEAERGELGILVARMRASDPQTDVSGVRRVLMNVKERGDRWFVTRDVVVRDHDDDYWFMGQLRHVLRTPSGPVPTRVIEDSFYELDEVRLASVHAVGNGDRSHAEALVVLHGDEELDTDALATVLKADHPAEAIPRSVKVVDRIAMTDGYRPIKTEQGRRASKTLVEYRYKKKRGVFEKV